MQVFRTKRKVVAKFDNDKPIVLTFSQVRSVRNGSKSIDNSPRYAQLKELFDFLGNRDVLQLSMSPDIPIDMSGIQNFISRPHSVLFHYFEWSDEDGKMTACFPYNEIKEHIEDGRRLGNSRLGTGSRPFRVSIKRKRLLSKIILQNSDLFLARYKLVAEFDTGRPVIPSDITPEYLEEHIKELWFAAFVRKATDEEVLQWYHHKDRDGYVACFWDKLCDTPRKPRF